MQVLRHEEFEEGCKASCNGYIILCSVVLFRRYNVFSWTTYTATVYIGHTMANGASLWLAMAGKMTTLWWNWPTTTESNTMQKEMTSRYGSAIDNLMLPIPSWMWVVYCQWLQHITIFSKKAVENVRENNYPFSEVCKTWCKYLCVCGHEYSAVHGSRVVMVH